MIRVVHIQWHDAAAASGWHGKKELTDVLDSDPALCDSIGMLVERKNKEKVTIIQTMGSSEVSGVFEIPVGYIKSVKTICTLPLTIEV